MKKYAKEFRISTAPQRSPKWYEERAGIPSASGLGALFETLKDGFTPSARSREYRKQLAFERKFKTVYEKFETKAMRDGKAFEDFAKMVYEKDTGNKVDEAFSFISDWFVATPDGIVIEAIPIDKKASKIQRGLLECKIVGDATFMEMLEEGMPLDHELQTQGQLLGTGFDWVDYIVVNVKTKAYFIRREYRNNKLIQRIYDRLHEPLELPELNTDHVKMFDENLLKEFLATESNPKGELPF